MGSGRTERSRRSPIISKRACVRVTLLLVAGATVNVAVAWGCAAWMNQLDVNSHTAGELPREFNEFGSTRRQASGANRPDISVTTGESITVCQSVIESRITRYTLGEWGGETRTVALHKIGFPHHSMMFMQAVVDGGMSELWRGFFVSDLVAAGARRGLRISVEKVLPMGLIWPGFAINTAFYAFILWLLFAVPFALRRRRRIKRGLCVKCAYDLRGRAPTSDHCPECGTAVVGFTSRSMKTT